MSSSTHTLLTLSVLASLALTPISTFAQAAETAAPSADANTLLGTAGSVFGTILGNPSFLQIITWLIALGILGFIAKYALSFVTPSFAKMIGIVAVITAAITIWNMDTILNIDSASMYKIVYMPIGAAVALALQSGAGRFILSMTNPEAWAGLFGNNKNSYNPNLD